jgi:aromatic ring-opening dioxygenase LigB subunit
MNPFVFACITPHGSEIIEELSQPNPQLMGVTRGSMEQLGRKMEEAKPDTIIVLTPHGVRVDGQFAIADCERMYGELEDNGGKVTMERQVDRELAKAITVEAKKSG